MGNARRVRDAQDGNLSYLLIVCDTADHKILIFHRIILLMIVPGLFVNVERT